MGQVIYSILSYFQNLKELYRKDYGKHMGFEDSEEMSFDGILLTHAHVHHHAHNRYLRPDITIYCSEATKLVLQAIKETSGSGIKNISQFAIDLLLKKL